MQVTPIAATRNTCKRFSCSYDVKRLKNDMPYNLQVGAAELGGLMQDYRGNYILSYAGYNAGRGRVQEWIAKFGDPRDPKVDPVDWVERIPVHGNPQLRAACDGEHAGLSDALRRRATARSRRTCAGELHPRQRAEQSANGGSRRGGNGPPR